MALPATPEEEAFDRLRKLTARDDEKKPDIPGVQLYEALPSNFNGGSDAQDHLVRWVGAMSKDEVRQWMAHQGLQCGEIHVIDHLSIHDAGVDAVIYNYPNGWDILEQIRADGRHYSDPQTPAV